MHWLSTLGGAYSNLGEHSLAFAHQACDNAFRQMKIAVRSQDPFNIDRCWLYVAMSLMQQGELKKSRKIIEHIYRKTPKNKLIERRTEDEKLENSRFWIEKSRKDAQLMMKLKMSGEGNQELTEKVHSSFEEKEKILEDLKLILQ